MPFGGMGPDLAEGVLGFDHTAYEASPGHPGHTRNVRRWISVGPSQPEVLWWDFRGVSGNQRQGECDLNDYGVCPWC